MTSWYKSNRRALTCQSDPKKVDTTTRVIQLTALNQEPQDVPLWILQGADTLLLEAISTTSNQSFLVLPPSSALLSLFKHPVDGDSLEILVTNTQESNQVYIFADFLTDQQSTAFSGPNQSIRIRLSVIDSALATARVELTYTPVGSNFVPGDTNAPDGTMLVNNLWNAGAGLAEVQLLFNVSSPGWTSFIFPNAQYPAWTNGSHLMLYRSFGAPELAVVTAGLPGSFLVTSMLLINASGGGTPTVALLGGLAAGTAGSSVTGTDVAADILTMLGQVYRATLVLTVPTTATADDFYAGCVANWSIVRLV